MRPKPSQAVVDDVVARTAVAGCRLERHGGEEDHALRALQRRGVFVVFRDGKEITLRATLAE